MSKEEMAAIEKLAREIPVNINDARERLILIRAINYADISNFTVDVKNWEDNIYNEIFLTRATHYFLRKKLNPFSDIAQIRQIEKMEHYRVTMLKTKLPPPISYIAKQLENRTNHE